MLFRSVGSKPGYWAGAPGVFYCAEEKGWYLTYRIRRPRGVAPDRGGEARIARSTDLEKWDDVWSVTKAQFGSTSIERCFLCQTPDDRWRYFVSYVDAADGRWCVSVLEAGEISKLDPAKGIPLFKAPALGLEGVKDPWIFHSSGKYFMFLSVALRVPQTSSQSHSTHDIYNTGDCVSATGLATSSNLIDWEWQRVVFSGAGVPSASAGGTAWDQYCRRINSVLPYGDKFLAFYDGSSSHTENYEEKTGLAVSSDLLTWQSLTPNAPLWTSPHGSGSLRYLDASLSGEQMFLFYEFARPDGAHDLRVVRSSIEALDSLMDRSAESR